MLPTSDPLEAKFKKLFGIRGTKVSLPTSDPLEEKFEKIFGARWPKVSNSQEVPEAPEGEFLPQFTRIHIPGSCSSWTQVLSRCEKKKMFRNWLPDVLTTCVGALHNVQGTHDFIEDEEEWEKQIMERLRRLTMNLQSPNPVPPEVLQVPVPEGNFIQKFVQKRKANQGLDR